MAAAPTAAASDVAAIIPERASGGTTWTGATIPTLAQVTALIPQIVAEVQSVVGPTIDDTLAALGTLTVSVGVAAQVELAFTNQVARDTDTKYEWLHTRFLELLARLDTAQQSIDDGGEAGDIVTGQPWATMPDPATTPVTSWTGGW